MHIEETLVLLSTGKQVQANIGTAQIENTQNEKLLGIIIDSKLSFDKHIQQICSRASAKLRALARIAPFMNITNSLQIVYNDNTSTYEELLETCNSLSVHFRKVQALAIELHKVVNGFSPDVMTFFHLMKTLVTTLGINERSIQGMLQLFILGLKHYHILHLKFGS